MSATPDSFESCGVRLREAASKGDQAQVRELLVAAVDLDATDKFGNTALIYAALGGYVETVRLLLDAGANAEARNQIGTTARSAAAKGRYVAVVETLDTFKPPQAETASHVEAARPQRPTLLRAAHAGDAEAVNTLLRQGADVNARDAELWTPLMVAAVRGHAEVVRSLLQGGADVNAGNIKGWTALMLAVSVGDAEMMRVLLQGGADADIRDREGRTPLISAAAENNVECLKVLLEHGADVNAADMYGETATTLAARHGYTDVFDLLGRAGAHINAASGHTPMQQSDEPDLGNPAAVFSSLWRERQTGASIQTHEPVVDQFVTTDVDQSATPETQALAHAGQPRPESLERLIAALESLRRDEPSKPPALSASEVAHKILLTLQEAAVLTGLSRKRLREAARGGALKAQMIGRRWRIKRADLDDYVRNL